MISQCRELMANICSKVQFCWTNALMSDMLMSADFHLQSTSVLAANNTWVTTALNELGYASIPRWRTARPGFGDDIIMSEARI